jgi:hypothetical protein
MLLMFCNVYTRVFKFFWCFASVLDVCCKCFSYFQMHVAMFHLDVAKVNLILYMLQWDPPATVAAGIAGTLSWVTVRVPEAGRRIRRMASIGGAGD